MTTILDGDATYFEMISSCKFSVDVQLGSLEAALYTV